MRVRLAIGVLLFVLAATIAAQETSSDRTVWAGVYTAEQATRGSARFATTGDTAIVATASPTWP